MRRPSIWFLIAALVSGCSTEFVQPRIETFSQSVEGSAGSVLERYESQGIPALYLAEYHQAMAAKGAMYGAQGHCDRPISLSVALDDPALQDFAHHCALVVGVASVKYDPVQGAYASIDPLDIRPPDGGPGVEGGNARRMALALRGYAAALAELAKANTPQDVGASFAAASQAAQGLLTETKKARGADGIPPATEALLGAGSSLLQSLLTEALEAKRYRLLKQLVTQADPVVEVSARVLAAWYYDESREEISGLYEQLNEAVGAAQNATLEQAADTAQRLGQVRDIYEALKKAETNAPWRVFLGVAEGHRAILHSLNAPTSMEQLLSANQRISRLIEQTQAFAQAIDAAKKPPKE